MRIDINQKKISLRDKFNIFVEGHPAYNAAKELFKLLPVINLLENDNPIIRMTARKRWSFFKIKYDIDTWDNDRYEFRTVNIWRRHYQCQVGTDFYDIYGHRGLKYSIFKNDKQVGFWAKESVTWFEGDNYKLIADGDSNKELLITFVLIIDSAHNKKQNKGIINFNIGYIGAQAKKFDAGWVPKFEFELNSK